MGRARTVPGGGIQMIEPLSGQVRPTLFIDGCKSGIWFVGYSGLYRVWQFRALR